MKKILIPLYIEIRPSKLLPQQIGLFAVKEIKKNDIVAGVEDFGEEFVPWSDFKSTDKVTQEKILQYCLQTEDGFYMPPNCDLNKLTVPWNMNHSCDYNVGFDEIGNFIAAKNIKEGDELVWDYGMGHSFSKFKLDCLCKSSVCRKIITGNDWKNKAFVEKNKEYFLRELLNKSI